MMKKFKKGSAFVATLAVVLSAMVIPRAYAAVEIDTDAKCSLDFSLNSEVYKEMNDLEIVVDLYKVGDVDVVGNYKEVDGFALGEYKLADVSDKTSAADWEAMASEAFADIEGKTPITSTVEEGFDNLEVGLYLVVANDTKSDTFAYTFKPYLISLPNNNYYSSGNDDWVYDLTGTNAIGLKPEATDLYGDLVVEKDLKSFNATVGGATFVFQVEATKDYTAIGGAVEKVYSDVVSITFDAAGNKTVLVEDIPAGAEVTVTEVYSGGSYAPVDGANRFETVIVADEVVEDELRTETVAAVTFENEYDDRLNGGSGVVNHFEEGENGWTWTVNPASAEVE